MPFEASLKWVCELHYSKHSYLKASVNCRSGGQIADISHWLAIFMVLLLLLEQLQQLELPGSHTFLDRILFLFTVLVSVSVSMWSQGDWRGNDLLTYYMIKMFRSALLNYHQTSFLLCLPLKWGPTLFLSHRGTPAFSPTFRSVCALWKAQQGFYGFCCSNLHWVTIKHSAEKLPDDRQTDR